LIRPGENVLDAPPVQLGIEHPDATMLWKNGEQPIWVTAGPIVASAADDSTSPGHGVLILGWALTDRFLSNISSALGGKVELVQGVADSLDESPGDARTAMVGQLEGIEGEVIAGFRLTQSRNIVDTSIRAFLGLSIFLLLAMGAGLLLLGFAAERALVRPLVLLRQGLSELRERRALTTPLPLGRPDELGELAREVEALSADLRESERRRRDHQIAQEKAEQSLHEKEEHLRQSQRMEAIGLLAGGIAHDFNNLLTTILGYCEILSIGKSKGEPGHEIEQIAKAGKKAANLTSQLLAFSRKQILEPSVIDLNHIVVDMKDMLQRLIAEDVELVTDLAPDLHPVKADPGQIEQVIMNLIVNARDAMPHGGVLKIATRNVGFKPERGNRTGPGGFAEIEIADTGDGMDSETLEKIFDPFFTTKALGEGTGLGLSTVYGIVTQSGGRVTASSLPGEGSTFLVHLPQTVQAIDSRPEESATTSPSRDGRETILLVEDDDGVRSLTRTILESGGYKVLDASRPVAALDIVSEHAGDIDLLVTDVVMPDLSGPELVTRIEALRAFPKVLFISGYVNDAVSHDKMPTDGATLLEKPFTAASLLQMVRTVLDSDGLERSDLDMGRAQSTH
jgi:signal transduction histidine kinase/ActR/RegA family two-component response regulator